MHPEPEKQKGADPVASDPGQPVLIQMRYNLLDPIPAIKIGDAAVEIAKPLRWFDSRAKQAIERLTKSDLARKDLGRLEDGCPRFFARCEAYREKLETALGRRVSPRELDKVLLAVHRRQPRAARS